MKVYVLTLQLPCGPRANPRNHRRTLVVQAHDAGEASRIVWALPGHYGLNILGCHSPLGPGVVIVR
jgi:hypothetical protein